LAVAAVLAVQETMLVTALLEVAEAVILVLVLLVVLELVELEMELSVLGVQ
jgi:hypothetical protein